jgi:hypothetical protein
VSTEGGVGGSTCWYPSYISVVYSVNSLYLESTVEISSWPIDGYMMSRCRGNITIASKIDKQMLDYIDAEADRLGVSRAEFLRRLLELYQSSRRENEACPECGTSVVFDLRE